jgi:hypothetical protein
MVSPFYGGNDNSCDEPHYNKHAMAKLSSCFQQVPDFQVKISCAQGRWLECVAEIQQLALELCGILHRNGATVFWS